MQITEGYSKSASIQSTTSAERGKNGNDIMMFPEQGQGKGNRIPKYWEIASV